jgi:Reverse transcriptase (RNA-dependent DNA polymerase)
LGVPQSSVLSPIVCNFILAYLTNNFFFSDPFFPKTPTLQNLKCNIRSAQVNRFILGYADDLIIKVISKDESDYALKKLISKLFEVGLKINSEKTYSYDLSMKARFN